jgi:hypothetical protein
VSEQAWASEDLAALLRPMITTLDQLLFVHPGARVICINAPRMELRRRGLPREDADVFGRLVSAALPQPWHELRYDRTLLALVAGVSEVVIDWIERGMTDCPETLADHLTGFGVTVLSAGG